MLISVLFFFLWALAEPPPTGEIGAKPPLYSGQIEKLESFGQFELSTLSGRKSLWYFFQPACPSCARQAKSFGCLAPETPIVAIGVLGSREKLQKELKRHGLRGQALFGGSALSDRFRITQTPTIFIVSEQGALLQRYNSLVSCDILKSQL